MHLGNVSNDIDLWVKDEGQCPTGTFKDRLAWKLVEEIKGNRFDSSSSHLISCITMGNTLASVAYALRNGLEEVQRPQLLGVFPSGFSSRIIGPDTSGRTVTGHAVLRRLREQDAVCIECPSDEAFLTEREIANLARNAGMRFASHRDITNGIGVPGYRSILAEALDGMPVPPDWVVVPVGAGVLFKECIDEVVERNLASRVIGVTVLKPTSIADKLYGRFSPYYDDLVRDGVAYHEGNKRFVVVPIEDDQIANYTRDRLPFDSEPSGWAAFVPIVAWRLSIPQPRGRILAIHTGNGIPFALASRPNGGGND